MKKTLLFGFLISLVFYGCGCSEKSQSRMVASEEAALPHTSSEVLGDVLSDIKSQMQSTSKMILSATKNVVFAISRSQPLAAPIIITPDSTTNHIVYAANSEGMLCIYDGKKYGFINEYGNESIPFVYDKAYPFCEGLACVCRDERFGFINHKGETVLPFIYDQASSFHEGLAYFEIGDQYGFIDEKGNQVFLLDCDSVNSFNEGLAYFSDNGKYGYIDKTGKVVIEPIYDDVDYFENGLAKVRVNDKVGIINRMGQEIVPISYDDVEAVDGFFITQLDYEYGCINGKGKTILPEKYPGVYVHDGVVKFFNNDTWYVMDEKGHAIEMEHEDSNKVPNSDLSIARRNDQYGIVNSRGEIIVPFQYDDIGYFDFQTKFFANYNPAYEAILRFSVSIGEKYGVIDESGNSIVPCIYDSTQIFSNGMMMLQEDYECSLADKEGRIVSKKKYDHITQVGDFFLCEINGMHGFLNEKGEEVVPTMYDYITLYYNDVFNSDTCFVASNYGDVTRDSIIVTKLGSKDDLSDLIMENHITPKIKLFHEYIQNCPIEDFAFIYDPVTKLNQLDNVIKTYRLYQIEGSNHPILYIYVRPIFPQGFPASYSGFFSIDNDKVNTLISGSESGGSMGGDYVCLYKDNMTSKIIIARNSHAGGFGGNAYGREFYDIVNGKAQKITSYLQVSQITGNYDESYLLENAQLFYDDNDLPYTQETIKDAKYVREYDVDDNQTTITAFKSILQRFHEINYDISD